jgi:hypothetical protein
VRHAAVIHDRDRGALAVLPGVGGGRGSGFLRSLQREDLLVRHLCRAVRCHCTQQQRHADEGRSERFHHDR